MLKAIEHNKRCIPPLKKIKPLLPLLLQLGDFLLPITDLLTNKEIVLRYCRERLLSLSSLGGCHRSRRFLSLPTFIGMELRAESIPIVPHCIQLNDRKVVLLLDVLEDIKQGVLLVRPVVPDLGIFDW
jgi:hypothetical protein